MARLAEEHGLRFATHTWSDAVAVVANAHAVATQANGITVEIDRTGNPFIDDLLTEPLRVDDGVLRLSDATGLGMSLDLETVERYRLRDPLTIPAGSYSDMTLGAEYLTYDES